MTLPKPVTILIGSALALATLPAMADRSPDHDLKSVDVGISEYDLTKSEDAQRLYKKIESAAKRACRRTSSRPSLREHSEEVDCREDAIERAVVQLNAPVLTLVMNGQNPSS